MKAFLTFPFFLFLLSIAYANILPPNCNAFQGEQFQDCQNILTDSSLSQPEKEDLYLNLVNNQSDLASHDFVWTWNTLITFNQAPDSVTPANSGIVRNAWLKIVGVKKSVFDTNQQKLFTRPQGSVLTAKNYGIELPSGTLPGECRTDYAYSITNNQFQVLANGQSIGNGNIANYSFSLPNQADLNFLADWQLTAQLRTDHYQNQQHCFFDGKEWHCWYQCDYTNTSYDNYSIQLQDFLPTTITVQNPAIQTRLDTKNEQVLVEIDPNGPLNQFTLNQENLRFSFSSYRYDINQVLAPYGALNVIRIPEQKTQSSFIILDQNQNRFKLATNSSQDCSVKIATDFEEIETPCNAVMLKPVHIELVTDQNSFDENQTIQLQAILLDDQNQPVPNKTIEFSSKAAKESLQTNEQGTVTWELPAENSNGILNAQFLPDAEFSGTQETKRVPIAGTDLVPKAVNVFTFFFAYYFLFIVAKTKLGVI